MSASGISSLTAVTMLKSNQANEDALHGADKARDLVTQQRDARARLRAFEDMVRDNEVTSSESSNMRRMLLEVGADATTVHDGDWDGLLGHEVDGEWTAFVGDVSNETQAHNAQVIDGLRGRFEDKISDLESEDKMGNFEIQDLMARFNQNQQLASSVQKKKDDTSSAVIGKV